MHRENVINSIFCGIRHGYFELYNWLFEAHRKLHVMHRKQYVATESKICWKLGAGRWTVLMAKLK